MSTLVTPPPVAPPPPVAEDWTQKGHIVLNCVPWEGYLAISDALDDQPVRMNYCEGSLEIMTVSWVHELFKSMLRRLIEILTFELEINIASGGSLTLRKELAKRGMEPDECYWIQNEQIMRTKKKYDPVEGPPPDLAIEIEVSRTIVDRLDILSRFRVPEVWRFDGRTVTILLLDAEGNYVQSPRSLAFPFFPVAELPRFLAMRETMGETRVVRAFRDWVCEQRAAWGR
jgi:Uma2 family endonuclease